jgi:organic hydroperoxide reductase OsmC/OhrA
MSECTETESGRELDIPYPKKLTIKKEPTMTQIKKVFYTAKTHTTGDRESGVSRSSDGRLDIKLSTPDASGTGTTRSSFWPPVGRLASYRRSRSWPPE